VPTILIARQDHNGEELDEYHIDYWNDECGVYYHLATVDFNTWSELTMSGIFDIKVGHNRTVGRDEDEAEVEEATGPFPRPYTPPYTPAPIDPNPYPWTPHPYPSVPQPPYTPYAQPNTGDPMPDLGNTWCATDTGSCGTSREHKPGAAVEWTEGDGYGNKIRHVCYNGGDCPIDHLA